MISARYASCWEAVRAATRRCSSERSVANKRIRVRRGLERGMCEGAFGVSHYNRAASASIPYLHQPTGRGTKGLHPIVPAWVPEAPGLHAARAAFAQTAGRATLVRRTDIHGAAV